jgi:hypothetical protein
MKQNTYTLTGHALNWAVAMAEGNKVFRPRIGRPDDWDKEAYIKDGSDDRWVVRVENPKVAHFVDWTYAPSTSWMQGGNIIEREQMCVQPSMKEDDWFAASGDDNFAYGKTPLIAVMRCYVASKLGSEVDIPEELLTKETV